MMQCRWRLVTIYYNAYHLAGRDREFPCSQILEATSDHVEPRESSLLDNARTRDPSLGFER
jgi:hypothetical protein